MSSQRRFCFWAKGVQQHPAYQNGTHPAFASTQHPASGMAKACPEKGCRGADILSHNWVSQGRHPAYAQSRRSVDLFTHEKRKETPFDE